jgi:hypothetical protein
MPDWGTLSLPCCSPGVPFLDARPLLLIASLATLTPLSLETILRNTLGTTQAVIQRTIATPSKEILLVQSKLDIERPPAQDFSITCRPLP